MNTLHILFQVKCVISVRKKSTVETNKQHRDQMKNCEKTTHRPMQSKNKCQIKSYHDEGLTL